MARRRITTSATAVNLDSMLDTLMNVVGILVIVLVAVQLSSQEAARRITEEAEKLDPKEVARLEAALDTTKQRAEAASEALRLQRANAADPKAELSRLRSQLQVEEDLAKSAAARAATIEKERAATHAAAVKAMAKASADREHKESARKALEKKLVEMRRDLEKLPVLTALPIKEVRLPDPRPAPPNVTEIHVLCRESRIWLVDIKSLQEKGQKRADFIVRSKKLDPDGDTWLADGAGFVAEFNKTPVKEGGFEMTLDLASNRWPRLVLTRMKGSGETTEQAVKASGELARLLRRLDAQTHVVRFFVWPNSFETYLEIREFTGGRGFAAGWDPVTAPDEYRIALGKYAVGTKPPPTPKDPNAKPPPPRNVLD